jgi:hypothetical protein
MSVADDNDRQAWLKRFGSEANNTAWTLAESDTTDAAVRDALLVTACAAAYFWKQEGTAQNVALADILLARAFTVAEAPLPAMRFATRALNDVSGRVSEPWEMAFAHAIFADASRLNGDMVAFRAHYEQARTIGETLDTEDREIFLATFHRIAPPLAE